MAKRWKKDSCFFCGKSKATQLFHGNGKIKWPAPLDKDSKFGMCVSCSVHLKADEIAAHIVHYINCLRIKHNQKVRANLN